LFPGLGRIGPPSCTYILPWAGMGTFDSANFRPFGRFRECDTGCPFFGLAPRGKLESEEGSIDAPMVRPRPGYRRRSVPGPTAVERRRWLGLGRRIGRGRRPARDAPSFHRGRNAHHDALRPAPSPPRIGATRCKRSIIGPQAVDRRRWFGPDRHIGRD